MAVRCDPKRGRFLKDKIMKKEKLPTAEELRKLVTSISLNESNVKHCLAYNTINGSILIDIEDVCHKWAQINTAPLQAIIEELEEERDRVKELFDLSISVEKIKDLKAENERLREALKPIANTHDYAIEVDAIGIAKAMRNKAKDVLKGENK